MNWSNYVILLAGGYLQLRMANEIKNRGYDLLLIDGNPDCYCRKYADEFRCIDTYDFERCEELVIDLYKKDKTPKAILTDAADVSLVVSRMCAAIGLPSVPVEIAYTINDKAELYHALNGARMPLTLDATGMLCIEAFNQWCKVSAFWDTPKLPVVFKPTNNCGSRGIVKINTVREWETEWPMVFQFEKYGQRSILIQEYISGPEIATDWWVQDGEVMYINGACRVFDGFGFELGHTNPYWPVHQTVYDAAQQICDATNYYYGPLKVDFMFVDDTWLILEAATRWSGGFDHGFTAKLATKRNLEAPLLDYALGKPVNLKAFNGEYEQHAAALGIHYNSDRYDASKVKDLPLDIEVHLTGNLGGACAARNLWLLTTGKDAATAWQKLLTAQNSLTR